MAHPCLHCGACCAHFRVAFHWLEADPEHGGQVPAELTEPLDRHRLAMRGTQSRQPRCVALAGPVGAARCAIYERRPGPCRALQPTGQDGLPSPQCDRARHAHGLAPLIAADWPAAPAAA